MGAGFQVIERNDLCLSKGTRFGKHTCRFGSNIKPLRELDKRRDRIKVILRVDKLVAPRIGVDKRLDIGGRAARSRDDKLGALVRRENLVKPRLHPLDSHRGTLVRPADDYADEVVGCALITLLERGNALLVEFRVVGDEVRRDLNDVGKLRRIVKSRRENAVKCREFVAARIEDYAALRAEPACKRLSRVESARASADYSGGVGELRSSSIP